jgi:hypothetical protein
LGVASDEVKKTNSDRWEVNRILEELGRVTEELSECGVPEGNRTAPSTRIGDEAKPPAKPILDLADTLKAEDRAWMHSDSPAKAQMLLGYLARPAREDPRAAAGEERKPIPPDFESSTTTN